MLFKDVDDKHAIEYYFKQCKYPDFLLPVSDALTNPITAPLVNNKTTMLRNMGATGDIIKSSVRLAENYDLIIFFNDTDGPKK
jgi:erythromycin esterase